MDLLFASATNNEARLSDVTLLYALETAKDWNQLVRRLEWVKELRSPDWVYEHVHHSGLLSKVCKSLVNPALKGF